MSTDLVLKRGDAFKYRVAVTDETTGDPVPIAGWGIASQLRNQVTDALVCSLTVSERNDSAGTYVLSSEDDTKLWALARLVMDIEYSIGGQSISTDTLTVDVKRDITRPG